MTRARTFVPNGNDIADVHFDDIIAIYIFIMIQLIIVGIISLKFLKRFE